MLFERLGRRRHALVTDGDLTCEEVQPVLDAVAEGGAVHDLSVRRHVESCERCRIELAEHKTLLKMLRSIRSEMVEPAPSLVGDILGALEDAGERHAVRALMTGRRLAYLGGIAVATAAGVGGAIVLSRRRRVRVAA